MRSLQRDEPSRRAKTERLEARITPEQKELFSKAAALKGTTLSDFALACMHDEATRTVREYEAMILNAHDSKAFVASLLRQPAPGARLRKAAERYKARR